jgi:hypothetical protein
MKRREPRLLALERTAAEGHRNGESWFDTWAAIEPTLRQLVGWIAERPGMRSVRHWEVAYGRLVDVWATERADPAMVRVGGTAEL